MISLGAKPPHPGWGDGELIEACLGGQQAAWEALIHKYKRLVYSIPFRYGAGAEDAADIFQAVCIELYAELPKLRNADSLRSWLMTVTARCSLKWKRGAGRYQSGVDWSETSDPLAPAGPEWVARAERTQVVSEALARLSDRCRLLVERLFFADPPQPYAEVARELGLAVGSMGFTRGRCLEKLRQALEELGYR